MGQRYFLYISIKILGPSTPSWYLLFHKPQDIIKELRTKVIHGIIHNKGPEEIYNRIRFSRSRACADLSLKYVPKTERLRQRNQELQQNSNRDENLETKAVQINLKKIGLK